MKVVLRPAAEQDVANAIEWYDARQEGLGKQFLAEVAVTLHKIGQRPFGYPATSGPIKRALLHRFRYAIFFKHSGDEIIVLAVFHQRRKPDILAKRIADAD